MPSAIELITTPERERAVRRFWYDIYVSEMGRHRNQSMHVDHERKELVNPWQLDADTFAATEDGKIIGTVQSAYLGKADCSKYIKLYGLATQPLSQLTRAAITSRLMVAEEYRSSGLAIALGLATYIKGLNDGIERSYIDCNEHLIRLYTRIGYREHLGWIQHPNYGRVYSMVIDLHDRAHFKAIRSPLLKTLDDYNQQQSLTSKESIDEQVA